MVVEPLGHDWEGPTYEWAEDNSTVTATRVCKARRQACRDTETVETTSAVDKPATCTEKVKPPTLRRHSKTLPLQSRKRPSPTSTPSITIGARSPTTGLPTTRVSRPHRVCAHDAEHVEIETAAATSEVTKPATCTEKGETTYTSAAFENTAFAVQKKTVADIDALDHDWGEVTYDWAADNSFVTATRVCKNDKDHVETETSETTSEVTKEATETEAGEAVYTAKFSNPAFEEQKKPLSFRKKSMYTAWRR